MALGGERKPVAGGRFRDVVVTNRDRATAHEKRIGKTAGVKVVRGSGSLPQASKKGDLHGRRFLWESKSTVGSTISLSKTVVEKLCRQAAMANLDPLLCLTIDGLPENLPRDWVCVPLDIWVEIAGGE